MDTKDELWLTDKHYITLITIHSKIAKENYDKKNQMIPKDIVMEMKNIQLACDILEKYCKPVPYIGGSGIEGDKYDILCLTRDITPNDIIKAEDVINVGKIEFNNKI